MKSLSILACFLFVVSSAPGQATPAPGAFGLSASFGGEMVNNNMTMVNGLNGLYCIDGRFILSGGFGLAAISNVVTTFSFNVGGRYQFTKTQLSPFVGGAIILTIISPAGAGAKSTTQFGFLLGGGAGYYFTKCFGVIMLQGLQFSTEPTTFAFVSKIGIEWYF